MSVIIEPTTAAVTASLDTQFIVGQRDVTLSADSLLASLTDPVVTVEYSPNGGKTWVTALDSTGKIVQLTETRHMAILDLPGMYRVAKDATDAACGVYAVA